MAMNPTPKLLELCKGQTFSWDYGEARCYIDLIDTVTINRW